MSAKKMNFKIAENIYNIYVNLLENAKDDFREGKYSFNDMNGYDLSDIINALHLMSAYRVYKTNNINDQIKMEYKRYALEDNSILMHYDYLFISDEVKKQLDLLDKNELDFNIKSHLIISNYLNNNKNVTIENIETPESFLDFCLSIKKTNNYWLKVFERLNLECDDANVYDLIYYEFTKELKKIEILGKENVQNNNNNNKELNDGKINQKKTPSWKQIFKILLILPIYFLPEFYKTIRYNITNNDISTLKKLSNIIIFPIIYISSPVIIILGAIIVKSDGNKNDEVS